jgi:septal ring factor EnvC (AmiA/AmiB activator)
MDIFDDIWRLMAYPRYGEIKRYKVVPMTEDDIIEDEIKELEGKIERRKRLQTDYAKQTAELEEELQKQKKRLKP